MWKIDDIQRTEGGTWVGLYTIEGEPFSDVHVLEGDCWEVLAEDLRDMGIPIKQAEDLAITILLAVL